MIAFSIMTMSVSYLLSYEQSLWLLTRQCTVIDVPGMAHHDSARFTLLSKDQDLFLGVIC